MLKYSSSVILSQGDENSINPEIIAKSIFKINLKKVKLTIIASKNVKIKIFKFYNFFFKNTKKLESIKFINPNDYNIPKKYSLNTALSCIYIANKLVIENKNSVLVTAPVDKHEISKTIKFSGHTNLLKKLSKANNTLMLMSTNNIKVAIHTEHIPLSKVSKNINIYNLSSSLSLLIKYCKLNNFKNICVLSLNPHAGDNKLIGFEESIIIKKAINKFKKSSIKISGPLPADSAFTPFNRKKYTVFLAMYHDQGMIPVKYEGFDFVTNITLGLPYIRTSPGHGTAKDIVNKNIASEKSLLKAIYEAIDLNKKYGN